MPEYVIKIFITSEINATQKNEIFRKLAVTLKSATVIIYNIRDKSIWNEDKHNTEVDKKI
jgi:hypothetical protein